MRQIGLSVVIPVYNSEDWIVPTIKHVLFALSKTNFDAEIIVVDDGSSDDSAGRVTSIKASKSVAIHLIKQKNQGRYLARKKGVSKATKQNILFIDSRVHIDEHALKYLESELKTSEDQIWNGHVHVYKTGNVFARFWDAIATIGWRRYFKKPARTSYGIKDFDHYPKGTGFFYVPKKRLTAAMRHFEKTSGDLEFSSDDTLLIRYLAERQDINLSPDFSCLYYGRSTMSGFLKHAYGRGQFFVDGFLRPGTRFFYPLIAVLLLSVILAAGLLIAPLQAAVILVVGAAVFALGLFVCSKLLAVGWKDSLSLATLGLPFAVVYLAGIWRGVLRKSKATNKFVEFMAKHRSILRGSLIEYLVVAALYLLAIGMFTGSLLSNLNTQIYAGPGDATAGFLWLNSTDETLNPFINFYDDTNYPYGEEASGFTLVTYMAYWMPMRILAFVFNPVAAINIVMIAGYMLSAMAMYLVVKRVTKNVAAAFIAGFAAAFVPYALIKSSAHMSYIFGGIFTLIIGAFLAFWIRPTVKRAAVLGGLMGVSLYVDGYFALILAVLGTSLVVAASLHSLFWREGWKYYFGKLKLALVAVAVLLIAVVPLVLVSFSQGSKITADLSGNRSDIGQEMMEYRSNVIDFILPQRGSLLWSDNADFMSLTAYKNERSNSGENTHYISVVVYVVCAVGGVLLAVRLLLEKRSSIKFLRGKTLYVVSLVAGTSIVAALASVAIMFSPEVIVKGIRIPLPGALLVEYDISYWRVMSRLFVLYNVAVVVWFGVALWLVYESIKATDISRKLASVTIVILVFSIIALEHATVFPERPYDFTKSQETFKWLKTREDIRSVAMLPIVDPLDMRAGDYFTAQVVHGKKLINQKTPDGDRLSNILGSKDISLETMNFLHERGVDAVVFFDDAGKCRVPNAGKTESPAYIEATKRYDLSNKEMVNTTLCTVVLEKDVAAIDPVYTVFTTGFSPSPNAPDQSTIVFKAGGKGVMRFVEDDLTTRYDGKVHLSARLRFMPEVAGARWQIKQSDTVVDDGAIPKGGLVYIDTTLDGRRDAVISIITPDYHFKLSDAQLENVVSSAVAR